MNNPRSSLGRYRLVCEILVWRHGFCWVVLVTLILIAFVAKCFVLPSQLHSEQLLSAQLAQVQQTQLTRAKSISAIAPPSREDEVFDSLLSVSVSEDAVSDTLRSIASIAARHGVALSQSDFQNSAEGHGGLSQLQVTLPLRAGYPQLRKFVEQVLLEFPGVSVDELALKRDSVAQNQVEVRVKLSLWVQPSNRARAKS